ncbi:hypothetical protein [Donghicola sp. XS_ASV15]|uniref:hypothetical protein n=1 Tax=Donghicola sp. XS_ASV15 TaxID=3241295 RepID=UPI0035133ED7
MDLITLEANAGRIEGIFSARPDIGRLWRVQSALVEAARTVAMEDIQIHEGDLVLRLAENQATSAETARGVDAARDTLAVLRAPGSLLDDPERAVARACRASVQIKDVSYGDAPLTLGSDDIQSIRAAVKESPTPFLAALKATIRFRQLTESWSPTSDRLIFVTAEHSVRQTETRPWGEAEQDNPFGFGLLSGMRARWTYLPATALSQGRFRSWSPMQPVGVRELIGGLLAEQARTLGAIPQLDRWVSRATEYAAGKHGKSRLKDVVTLSTHCPVLTVSMIRDGLGLKQRAAYNLVDEAEEAGILSRITARKTYRVWAVPFLADRIKSRPMPGARMSAARLAEQGQSGTESDLSVRPGMRYDTDAAAAREESVLAELDRALARADEVLSARKL